MKTTLTRQIIVISAAALAAAAPMAAFAAPPKAHASSRTQKAKVTTSTHEEYTSGTVEAYAPGTRMLKLSTGSEFKLAPSVTPASFKNGDRVTVGWKMQSGIRLADKVELK